MSNARISTAVAALAALTLEDLTGFSDQQVSFIREARRVLKANEPVRTTYGLTDHELALLANNKDGKIGAIKAVRERTGHGLAEAKNLVEEAIAHGAPVYGGVRAA